jgi:MFS family permease
VIVDGIRHLRRSVRAFSPDTKRYLVGSFLMGLGQGAQGAHLNVYLKDCGLDGAQIGRVVSASAVGVVVVSLPAAMLVERVRPGRIFAFGAAGFALSLLVMAFFPNPWLAVALSFAGGMLGTVRGVAAGPFFVRNEDEAHRTELFGIASATESLATVLTAWTSGAFAGWLGASLGAEALGLKWALAAAALPAFAAVVPFSRIRTQPSGHARSWRDYVFARDRGLVFRLTLPSFVIGLGAGLTIPFLNLYFRDRFDCSAADIGLYFSVSQVLMMGGFLAGPILARRFGHAATVVGTELLSMPFFLVLAVTDHLGLAVAAFWMRGALMNMNNPVVAAFAMEAVPDDQRTVTNSVRSFAWNSAWMVSSVVGGWLIEHHGYAPGMYATMGLYLVAAALFWSFFGRGRGCVRP